MKFLIGILLTLITFGNVKADTIIEVGVGFLSWDYSGGQALIVAERFADKYDIGIGLTEPQTCKCRDFKLELDKKTKIDSLSFLYAQRIFTYKRMEFGLGFGFWNKTSRVSGSILMFPLSIKVRTYKQLYFGIRHFSSGGSGEPNLGQDMATISWKF